MKAKYKIYANDGCPWGKDEGYKTLKDAKRELNEIVKEDMELGAVGMYYFIEKEIETDDAIYTEEVFSMSTDIK